MVSFSLNSLPLPPLLQPRKLTDTTSLLNHGGLKPIVVTGNPPTFVSAPGRRIVAVGDLHGDLAQARCAFEMAGVLDSDGRNLWTGGDTVLIQIGDILDRGEDEIAILSLLRSLDIQAKIEGGAVFQVNGNHETMNVEGDFRFVDQGAFEECMNFLEYLGDYDDNWDEAFVGWIGVSERWKENRKMSQSYWGPLNIVKRQKGVIARSALLRPGGLLACELAKHAVVLQVDDWIFCHGGLLPHHVAYGIGRMNMEVSHWMKGLNENDLSGNELPFIATRGYDSVVWSRLYSRDFEDIEGYHNREAIFELASMDFSNKRWVYWFSQKVYSILEETLQHVGAKAMVVGHTPQTSGINWYKLFLVY
ncbi:hypothetical protein GIB67_038922 [Kingdonia uniflora]|uniref:Calcineurin-like phosphoesterase domain-containing protein n=1 Tax=Kingdonia uniflora TaxID=39325 RepID=A0A7J7LQA0_9MAGN|nr:hypothetical protein GIB67_038922 [Kingdonia uniflora]